MRVNKIILFPGFVITLAERQILKSIRGRKTILTCPIFLIFTLLSWIISFNSHAQTALNQQFENLIKNIADHSYCDIKYNPSKTAAIVNQDCISTTYINFKTKKTVSLGKLSLKNHILVNWVDDNIATIENSCGTGCAKVTIFVAPATTVACADYEYRMHFLNKNEPPDYYHNRPLLIDPKRKIYVCYNDEKNIQIYPLPIQRTIQPPAGYFSEQAVIQNNKLVVLYKNANGQTKKIAYDYS